MVRHEGGTPSNNLIKDVPHRATVFVGPTLKSILQLLFVLRENYIVYYEKTYILKEDIKMKNGYFVCGLIGGLIGWLIVDEVIIHQKNKEIKTLNLKVDIRDLAIKIQQADIKELRKKVRRG